MAQESLTTEFETADIEHQIKETRSHLEPLATAGLVTILVIFMLVKREDLRNRLIGLLGHGQLTGTTRVLVDSAERLSSFLLSTTMWRCVTS
jgi:predicted PurR-regulated permease PerM